MIEIRKSKYNSCLCCKSKENIVEVVVSNNISGLIITLCKKCRINLAQKILQIDDK